MKIKLLGFLAIFLLFVGVQSSPGQTDNVTFNLSPYAGGTETQLTWSLSGDFTSGGVTMSSGDYGVLGLGVQATGIYSTAATSPNFTVLGNYSISGAGTLTSTSGTVIGGNVQSAQFQNIEFYQNNGSDGVAIFAGSSPIGGPSNTLLYTPGTDSYVVPFAFSNFNSGVYSNSYPANNNLFVQSFTQTLNVQNVPEPPTYILLGIGVLGILITSRRHKAA